MTAPGSPDDGMLNSTTDVPLKSLTLAMVGPAAVVPTAALAAGLAVDAVAAAMPRCGWLPGSAVDGTSQRRLLGQRGEDQRGPAQDHRPKEQPPAWGLERLLQLVLPPSRCGVGDGDLADCSSQGPRTSTPPDPAIASVIHPAR